MGQQNNRVLRRCLLLYPVILPGYLAMNQLGPMLPSPQGLSRLVCDSPRQLAWSCKVRISIDDHDHDTALIYIKSIVKFPQSPHTKKATGATEVSLSRAHPWCVWLAQAHFSLGIVSPSRAGSSLRCLMLLALPEPFSQNVLLPKATAQCVV